MATQKKSKKSAAKRPSPKASKPGTSKKKAAAGRILARPRAKSIVVAATGVAGPGSSTSALDTPIGRYIAKALRGRGLDNSPEVVATLAAVGNGYRKGPASDPEFLSVSINIDEQVAEALVDRYAEGVPPSGIDRETHRSTVRSTVDVSLAQLGVDDATGVARQTLTSLALGSWRPGFDEHARRNALAGFLVSWYRAGRDRSR
jgi:hypothetical protein